MIINGKKVEFEFIIKGKINLPTLPTLIASVISFYVCYIRINLSNFLVFIIAHDLESINEILYHEFCHHIDRIRGYRDALLAKKIGDITEREDQSFSVNSYIVYMFFYDIRCEGIAEFYTGLRKHRRIYFDPELLKEAVDGLGELCVSFKPQDLDKNEARHWIDAYTIGSMMVSIIIIHQLLKMNAK